MGAAEAEAADYLQHALQEEEAKLAECRAESRLRIRPGEGYGMLERVEKLLVRT